MHRVLLNGLYFFFPFILAVSQPVFAEPKLAISLELPNIHADPYHKPYVAIWLENASRQPITTLALWYQHQAVNQSQGDGKKWLKDLRQWWRKIGRTQAHKFDGVTGATRRPGTYQIESPLTPEQLAMAKRGELILHIEASREEGGRSYQRIKLNVGRIKQPAADELGNIQAELKE